jgi:MoCo/4Fe-4S cofactor protein with predicted Tat translocation signal
MSADIRSDLASIATHLEGKRGRQYWRTLEELADTPEFRRIAEREFPQHASEWFDPVGRRSFLRLMGASLALAGATACTRQPDELIVPYVRTPENMVPGRPLYFATAMTLAGSALGLIAESHEGRPTKIEGNPDHPSSLGATDQFAQGSVLQLYDPDRSPSITYLGELRPWGSFVQAMSTAVAERRAVQGAGLRFLTGSICSPTLISQLQSIMTALPQARWHQYEPAGCDQVYAGAKLAFGEAVETHYRFDRAQVVVALDADVFGMGRGSVRYSRDFANGRRVRKAKAQMNRLYVAEPMPTPTGATADHRIAVRASQIDAMARALAAAVTGGSASTGHADLDRFVAAAAKDLRAHRGAGIVVAGPRQPAAVHALVHHINHTLGNAGATIVHADPIEAWSGDGIRSLRDLATDMNNGQVQLLVIMGVNPAYTAPVDLKIEDALKKVPLRVHLGLYDDETAALCHWHINETHYLEQWSDARAHDGTVSIVQPLVEPLYHGRSAHELVAVFTSQPQQTAHDAVRAYWKAQPQAAGHDFEKWWRRAVHDGVIADTALPEKTVTPTATLPSPAAAPNVAGLEVAFAADPAVYDGRFANVGWLQEFPKPFSKLTWDNAVMMAPATARDLNLSAEDVVEVTYHGRSVKGPVLVLPGHAPGAVTIHLGYGRVRAGRVAESAGFNAYALRTSDAPWIGEGLRLRKTGDRYPLAVTQGHHTMVDRPIVRAGTLEDYKADPEFPRHLSEAPPKTMSMYAEYRYEGYNWGISVDQTVCTGCSACVVACVAENNIPVVGKAQVLRAREMHWLRIDTYYEGSPDTPAIYQQPMLCQHCENAPCEVVCPVGATTHSPEGLNEMTYNRCVGTRYCSNNCPYKVRRFNFLLYSDWETPSVKLVKNPDVTVRSRGVMEKCTYCVQRINRARQDSKVQGRAIRDGEIQTACQAACPTNAIIFGNMNDPNSRVAQLKAEAHDYAVLGDLNTRPHTTYLAAIRNTNAELGPARLHEKPVRVPGALPPVPPSTPPEWNSEKHY